MTNDIEYEPTREHWTPYEPWMRDVLADYARVSWHEGGDDYRAPFVHRHELAHEWDLRIHPDDVPERPTEHDPDEALAQAQAEVRWLTYLLGSHADGHRCTCTMLSTGSLHEPPDVDQDPWCMTHPDTNAIVHEHKALEAERDNLRARADSLAEDVVGQGIALTAEAEKWKAKHAALRADVENYENAERQGGYWAIADELKRAILDRDDERGEQG